MKEKIAHYTINRKNSKGKDTPYIRFVNLETKERKEVSLNSLKKDIGDTKRFQPSNAYEIERIVEKAIDMGIAPFCERETSHISLIDYIKDFWTWDTSDYIQTKKEETGKTITKATAKKNLHDLLMHVFESDLNKKDKNGNKIGSYFIPASLTPLELTKEHIEKVKKSMLRDEKLKPKTVKNILTALNVPLNELARNDVIESNPMNRVRPIAISQTETIVDALTDEEIENLCLLTLDLMESNLIWNKLGLIILLAAATGMRQAEILSLQPFKIRPIEGTNFCSVEISRAYNPIDGFKSPKNGKSRFSFIDNRLADLINEIQPDKQKLIFGQKIKDPNTPLNTANLRVQFIKAIKKLQENKQIDFRDDKHKIVFHSLRHYVNTEINYRAGENTANIIIGHSKGNAMNERYSHITKRIAERFSKTVGSLLSEKVLKRVAEYTEKLRAKKST